MRTLSIDRLCLVLVCIVALGGCGERPDELGPYVERLRGADEFNAKLVEFRYYLKSDQVDKAADVAPTIEKYVAFMTAFEIEDKKIRAGHNALKRSLETSLKKIVEPDFPTFVISALKQIAIIEEGYVVHVNNLEKQWKEDGRPGDVGLSWPGSE